MKGAIIEERVGTGGQRGGHLTVDSRLCYYVMSPVGHVTSPYLPAGVETYSSSPASSQFYQSSRSHLITFAHAFWLLELPDSFYSSANSIYNIYIAVGKLPWFVLIKRGVG